MGLSRQRSCALAICFLIDFCRINSTVRACPHLLKGGFCLFVFLVFWVFLLLFLFFILRESVKVMVKITSFKEIQKGLGISSVVERLPRKRKALGSVPSSGKKKKKKKKKKYRKTKRAGFHASFFKRKRGGLWCPKSATLPGGGGAKPSFLE